MNVCRPRAAVARWVLGFCVRLPPTGGRCAVGAGVSRAFAAHGREMLGGTCGFAYVCRPRAGNVRGSRVGARCGGWPRTRFFGGDVRCRWGHALLGVDAAVGASPSRTVCPGRSRASVSVTAYQWVRRPPAGAPAGGRCAVGARVMRTFAARGREVARATCGLAAVLRPWAGSVGHRAPGRPGEHSSVRVNSRFRAGWPGHRTPLGRGGLLRYRVSSRLSECSLGIGRVRPR